MECITPLPVEAQTLMGIAIHQYSFHGSDSESQLTRIPNQCANTNRLNLGFPHPAARELPLSICFIQGAAFHHLCF